MPVSPTRPSVRRVALLAASTVSAALAVLAPSASALLPTSHTASAHADKTVVNKVKVDRRMFGVHDAHLTSLTRAGTGSIRLWDAGVRWAEMEPIEGVIDWTRLDQIVADAFANGTEVTFVTAMTPTWAAAPGYTVTDGTEAPNPDDFAGFVGAVMNRYRNYEGSGRPGIANYQLWNEANIKTFWTGTPQQMADLTKAAYDARAVADPAVRLIGPAQVSSQAWMRTWTRTFYGLSTGGQPVWKYLDAISLQLYPVDLYPTATGTRPGMPEDSMDILGIVKKILSKDGVPATLPIWNTEINYGLRFGDTRGTAALPIPDGLQVAYVMRTYLLNAARGVKRVYWYAYDLVDLPPNQGSGPIANTLLTDPADPSAGVVTPAGLAFKRVQSWMAGTMVGTTSEPPCTTDSKGTYTCVIKYAAGVGRVYWNPTRRAAVTLVRSARHKYNEYGVGSKVSGSQKLKVGYAPVLVRSTK